VALKPVNTVGGNGWPHRDRSRDVMADGLRWHLQHWPAPHPEAPTVLLLHGTGASTHSWRDLAPRLATQAGVLAVDLPGHGLSAPARGDGATLPGMARGLSALLAAVGEQPIGIVGHSAGAAIAVRMALAGQSGLRALVGLNAALLPWDGLASFFSPLAKLLALNPLVPHLFSWRAADHFVLQRLLDGTGSTLDKEGVALYRRLVTDPRHVAGALQMMARWDLHALAAELPRLALPLHLVVAAGDRAVRPADAQRVQALVRGATVTTVPGLGHLAHEERPQELAALVACLLDLPARRR
jgi:magnesium chelatase accessory protein